MAYEWFYDELERLEACQTDWENNWKEVYDAVTWLFDGLFREYPYGDIMREPPSVKDADLEQRSHTYEKVRSAIEAGGYEIVRIGSHEVVTGHPNPLPNIDMLERLKGLALPDTSYEPDSDGGEDEFDDYVELLLGITVRGSILYLTWLLSGYGDDLEPTHSELKRLLARGTDRFIGWEDENDDGFWVRRIRSLSERIDAELAVQLRNDYAEALTHLGQSMTCLWHRHVYDEYPFPLPRPAPWLNGIKEKAKEYFDVIERNPGRVTDWRDVANACEIMSRCFVDLPFGEAIVHDSFLETDETFWSVKKGWALNQMTPNQIRDHLQTSEDDASEKRLETYFFPDHLWERISKSAQEALVRADRALVSSTRGGWSEIPSDLRIATGEILNQCLWQPLIAWAEKQHDYLGPDFSAIRRAKEFFQKDPLDLFTYKDIVLPDPKTGRFLNNELHVSDEIKQVIRQRGPKFLERLRLERNPPHHQLSYTANRAAVRDLHAEALGIGRPGVLPSLLRLLASGRRGA